MRVCMHEYALPTWANLLICASILTPPGGGPAWAYLPYLPLGSEARWEDKRGAREERCYAPVCMSNHPDLTANHLQSF